MKESGVEEPDLASNDKRAHEEIPMTKEPNPSAATPQPNSIHREGAKTRRKTRRRKEDLTTDDTDDH